MDDKWRTAKPLYPLNETVRNELIKFILFFVATIYEISLFFKITPSIFWFSRREIGSIFIYHRVRRTRKIVDKSFHLWISKPRVRKILSKRRENENKNREWVLRRIFQWFFTQSTRRKTQRTSRFFFFFEEQREEKFEATFRGWLATSIIRKPPPWRDPGRANWTSDGFTGGRILIETGWLES